MTEKGVIQVFLLNITVNPYLQVDYANINKSHLQLQVYIYIYM